MLTFIPDRRTYAQTDKQYVEIVIWLLMNKTIGITFLQKWLILTLGLKTVVSVSTMTNFLFAHLQIYFLSIFL